MKKLIHILIIALIGITAAAQAATSTAFTQDQTQQIEQIVHNYLLNNPQVIVEVAQKLRDQETDKVKTQLEQIKNNVPKFKKEIFTTQGAGRAVAGNPMGKIMLVEFMQYQCGHCKVIAPTIDKLLKSNPDLKLVVIEWPFFGDDGVNAAKAALAAQKQGKFYEVHDALLATQDLTKDGVEKALLTIPGLDIKKLHADMANSAIDDSLKANFKLAKDLNLIGTPSFMFANQDLSKVNFVTGEGTNLEDDLNNSIKEVR